LTLIEKRKLKKDPLKIARKVLSERKYKIESFLKENSDKITKKKSIK